MIGDDWLIFVDARVLTRKLWTDEWTSDGRTNGHRRTVSDHNSSGELTKACLGKGLTHLCGSLY